MATILRAQLSGSTYDLDVFDDVEFRLDISAIESGEIGEVFGVSSQNLELPPTQNNNNFFGNLYDLGTTPAVTFIKTTPCQVLQDGQEVFSGIIYLDSVVTDNQGDIVYNAVVANETVDFKYLIQDLTFGDLDFSTYEHDYNITNVTSSWSENLFSGDIVYPLAEYGADENDVTSASLLKNGGQPNTFTNGSSPLLTIDFKPAIRVKAILDTIFDALPYTYTSSLIESDYFNSIYTLITRDETRGGAFTDPVEQNFKAYHNTTQTISNGSTNVLVEFNSEVYDNAGNWSTINDEFRAGADGTYCFSTALNVETTSTPIFLGAPRTIELELFVNGVPAGIPVAFFSLKGKTSDTIQANWTSVTLNTSDAVTLRISYLDDDIGVSGIRVKAGLYNNFIQCYCSPQAQVGGTVDMGLLFNPEDKVIDFINGIIQKFNLVIEPIPGDRNVLAIETFNDWVDAGTIVDWTDKVDYNEKWEIRHPLQDQPRLLKFSDVEDEDSVNTYHTSTTGKIYGEFLYDPSESDLADGEKTIGTFFAPTPMKYIPGTTDFIVPQIYKNDNGSKSRLAFKPRLFHYLGLYSGSQLTGVDENGALSGGEFYMANTIGDTVVSSSVYPVFHHNDALPSDQPTTRDLHFGNVMSPGHWSYHQAYVNAKAKRTSYYEYWSFYVNELYDLDSRKVTLNVYLKPSEIEGIRLNDKIHIDGHYYRIDKISGANITRPDSVSVTLIKSSPRKLRFPRRRIFVGDFDTPVDVTISDASINGTGRVEYVDYETGATVTDPEVISQAAGRDDLGYFSGSTASDWVAPQRPPREDVLNVGQNAINDRADNIFAMGNGNIIQGGSTNSTIIGDSNRIQEGGNKITLFGNNIDISGSVASAFVIWQQTGSLNVENVENIVALNPVVPITEYNNNKVVVGNILNQGSQYETYNVVEASPGSVLYLTGSEVQDRFHYHFTWSGSNGTAIVYINDATDPQYDGQMQRFTTDASLAASKVINITPVGGTIDGSAEEPLNKPYDGMTAEVINGDWLVVQRKG